MTRREIIFAFVGCGIGTAAGVLGSMQYFKKKYEAIALEEIESVKAVRKRLYNTGSEDTDILDHPPFDKESNVVYEKSEPVDYTKYYQAEKAVVPKIQTGTSIEVDKPVESDLKPYVISPSEFMSNEGEGYDTVTLTYYADGVLADENWDKVEDVENTVGVESLSHFGEYEDDSVYVRNDILRCDYEILLDLENYSDVLKRLPFKAREAEA